MNLEEIIEKIKNVQDFENFKDFEIIEGVFYHGTSSYKLDKIMSAQELLGTPINENIALSTGELDKNGIVFASLSEEGAEEYGSKIIKIESKAIKATHIGYDENTIEILIPANLLKIYENWEVIGGY